jgi:transposase
MPAAWRVRRTGRRVGTKSAQDRTPVRIIPSQALRTIRGVDRASLEHVLSQGLSLEEIGRRVGRHPSTVGYWVKKYGLHAVNREKHAGRGRLARSELEPLVVAGTSIAQIAAALGRSKASVRHWLGKYGLRTQGTIGARSREGVREAREAGFREATLVCPLHGPTSHVLQARGYYRCRSCRQEAVVRRRRKVKEILVMEGGGRCRLCGYDRCSAALQFHHLDPAAKEFGVAQKSMARSIERLRAEARKCILLCSNCHAEVESGIGSVSGVAQRK